MAAGQPKPAFYVVVGLVVVGLVAVGLWRLGVFGGSGEAANGGQARIDPGKLASPAEAPGGGSITTTEKYTFVPADKLPPVRGTAAYKPMQNDTVRFAINVWAGWGPIIFANNGFKATTGRTWKTPDGKDFKVELVLIDDPVKMRDAYAAGEVHVGWATLDMLPLFMPELSKDSRTMPRVYQQVDWSNGGDGIVVRDHVKEVKDLRGKQLVLAANSPSHYFALNMLVAGGVQPSEVTMIYTEDAFQAAAAFNAKKEIAGCVSWAPDIYNLEKVQGNRMLVTTSQANKLIADVWFARADFAKDHPDIIEALVRGIFDPIHSLYTYYLSNDDVHLFSIDCEI